LIALEAILLATGRISLGAAIALIGAVEVAVTLILMVVGWRATRGFEGPFLDRLEIGIAAVAGGVVARLMVTEFRMLGSLMPGLRGDMRLPPKSIAIPYARGRWAAPALFGFAALAELFAIDLLVPWDRMGSWGGLRWVALGLGAYGVLWVIMWVCAERAHPHYVSSTELVLRSGPMTIMRIPLAHVVKVAKRGYGDPSDDTHVLAAPLAPPNLDLHLSEPAVRLGWFGKSKGEHSLLALAVDDPAAAITAISG
jgi:hypothetical protein